MKPQDRLIVALDIADPAAARRFVRARGSAIRFYKVGSILFTRAGPAILAFLKNAGKRVFLDLKFHDIPNTVGGTAEVCAALGVDFFNVHLAGGQAMLHEVARRLAAVPARRRPRVLGVTVLTSFDEATFQGLFGSMRPLADQVVALARLGRQAGLAGVVASAQEAPAIRAACGKDFLIVTPGVRLPEDARGDQARVLTPGAAIRAGADYLVVGRPILDAPDPGRAARHFIELIARAGEGA